MEFRCWRPVMRTANYLQRLQKPASVEVSPKLRLLYYEILRYTSPLRTCGEYENAFVVDGFVEIRSRCTLRLVILFSKFKRIVFGILWSNESSFHEISYHEINCFQGDLTDVSAKTKTLAATCLCNTHEKQLSANCLLYGGFMMLQYVCTLTTNSEVGQWMCFDQDLTISESTF